MKAGVGDYGQEPADNHCCGEGRAPKAAMRPWSEVIAVHPGHEHDDRAQGDAARPDCQPGQQHAKQVHGILLLKGSFRVWPPALVSKIGRRLGV
jgi:hypothetical protein